MGANAYRTDHRSAACRRASFRHVAEQAGGLGGCVNRMQCGVRTVNNFTEIGDSLVQWQVHPRG